MCTSVAKSLSLVVMSRLPSRLCVVVFLARDNGLTLCDSGMYVPADMACCQAIPSLLCPRIAAHVLPTSSSP
ncbi:hypothetical protein F5Y08DRAFT_310724 [Xylaria arbuscula]|nr:hypothetical protein F5Y08DRAFT_310724 [Xylaria arbuscula]